MATPTKTLAFLMLLFSEIALASPPVPRGDWDGDGIADLAVGLVRPLAGGAYQTEILARGSGGSNVFYVIPQKTDAFAIGRYLPGEPSVPTSVLVTSINEPLLWSLVVPSSRQLLQVRYGLPGDGIKNAISFDGDGLDDIYVIRRGPLNEYGDNKSYSHWYIVLTSPWGQIVDVVFGLPSDRLFTFYDGTSPNFGAVRIETSGPCAGQFAWYWMNFSLDPSKMSLKTACWGLPGDIPLVPGVFEGRMKLVVVRPTGAIQVAYIRDLEDAAMWKTVDLGLADAIPGLAPVLDNTLAVSSLREVSGDSLSTDTFFWHQRSTPGLGDTSFVGMHAEQGQHLVSQFGITSNVILRPDGTVVQPQETDKLDNSPTLACSEIIPPNGSSGTNFLWKTSSDDTGDSRQGFPLILMYKYSGAPSCFYALAANGQPFSCLGKFSSARYYEGYGCGMSGEAPCYGRNSGAGLAEQSLAVGGTRGGYIFDPDTKRCYTVNDFAVRYPPKR